jgi:hypothetical protein
MPSVLEEHGPVDLPTREHAGVNRVAARDASRKGSELEPPLRSAIVLVIDADRGILGSIHLQHGGVGRDGELARRVLGTRWGRGVKGQAQESREDPTSEGGKRRHDRVSGKVRGDVRTISAVLLIALVDVPDLHDA